MIRHQYRAAMTLFEVAVSLGICAIALSVAFAIIPLALRYQERARYQVYASAKVMDVIESFAAFPALDKAVDSELKSTSNGPWETTVGYRVFQHDIEAKVAAKNFGLRPLPLTIARRLDSDRDEIQRILDAGGHVYYGAPLATTNLRDQAIDSTRLPSTAARLVYGFVGAPQQNAVTVFPWKAVPYYAPYPSPPVVPAMTFDYHDAAYANAGDELQDQAIRTLWHCRLAETLNPVPTAWTSSPVYGNYQSTSAGFAPYGGLKTLQGAGRFLDRVDDPAMKEVARRYAAVAWRYASGIWLSGSLSASAASYLGGAQEVPYATVLADLHSLPQSQRADMVRALRHWAHAAICLTRQFTKAELEAGVDLPSYTITSPVAASTPATTVTLDGIRNIHENCLRMAMAFAASFPYDWGAPRPSNRSIMMDVPLIQWDISVFGNQLQDILAGTSAAPASMLSGPIALTNPPVIACQWRPVTPEPVLNPGYTRTHSQPVTMPAWGDATRFSLTAAFSPAERCREIVVWAVDWQAYEDFESAPSAPVDASRFPLLLPGTQANAPFTSRITIGSQYIGDAVQHSYRNPEKTSLFVSPDPADATIVDDDATSLTGSAGTSAQEDLTDMAVFRGDYGADRNRNYRKDTGPVPRATRMKATLVGRFMIYDPRLTLILR